MAMPTRPKRAHPVERTVLDNGLKVLAVPDRTVPLVGVAVVYNVGFRSEPEGRTGFAHLFEHMMFQGSAHVGKMEHGRLVESAGGRMNGHTLPDLTAYYEALPPSALELALFLEADRMASLSVSEENLRNQVDVVKEEIRVNVLNRPYGGFPWILLPALAFTSYPNAHNGYGDFTHLEEATVGESEDFYATFYSPANAVLAVVGRLRRRRGLRPGRALLRLDQAPAGAQAGPVARAPARRRPATGSSATPWPPSPRSPSATGRPTPSATLTVTSSTTSSPQPAGGRRLEPAPRPAHLPGQQRDRRLVPAGDVRRGRLFRP